jgi:hypothetical protein
MAFSTQIVITATMLLKGEELKEQYHQLESPGLVLHVQGDVKLGESHILYIHEHATASDSIQIPI